MNARTGAGDDALDGGHMKYSCMMKFYGAFYYSACKKEITDKFGKNLKADIMKEYKNILLRAKDIGQSNVLLNAYCMGAYFIAMNRCTGLTPQENIDIYAQGFRNSTFLKKMMGTGERYLSEKRLPKRLEWDQQTHKHQFENDWVVTVIPGNDQFDLGYDYTECGVCKLCRDEGCFELAKYICKMDFVLAEIMGMRLERTQTIAEGCEKCDFRYHRGSSE
jgi:hypothetical protein